MATASALGVTIPFVAGPGGGGFMVIYMAKQHQVITIDGRETCPRGLHHHDVHRPQDRQAHDYDYARPTSRCPPACPRMLATWATAVKPYGRLSLGR